MNLDALIAQAVAIDGKGSAALRLLATPNEYYGGVELLLKPKPNLHFGAQAGVAGEWGGKPDFQAGIIGRYEW